MVGEEVAQRLAEERCGRRPLVEERTDARITGSAPSSALPTTTARRLVEVPLRADAAASIDPSGSMADVAAGRPEDTVPPARDRTSSSGTGRRARARLVGRKRRHAVHRDRAARMRADLRVGDDPVGVVAADAVRECRARPSAGRTRRAARPAAPGRVARREGGVERGLPRCRGRAHGRPLTRRRAGVPCATASR